MRYVTLLLTVVLTGCLISRGASEEERRAYVQKYDRPASVTQAILNDTLAVGMTKREVQLVMGEPGSVNKYETDELSRINKYEITGVREEWSYGLAGKRVIIQDGRVVAVSRSRALEYRRQSLGAGTRPSTGTGPYD